MHEAPLDPILDRLYRLSLASSLCRLVYETVSKNRLENHVGRLSKADMQTVEQAIKVQLELP